jgi:hypothetical protein
MILAEIDTLKAQLDLIRPLEAELVNNLREVYDLRLTYNSNAIEGNSLTQSETQIAIVKIEERGAYIEAIMAWQAGDDAPLKTMIATAIKSSLEEILSLSQQCKSTTRR